MIGRPMVRLVLSPLKRVGQIAHRLRRRLVRAAPTCTLWVLSEHTQVLRFRFCRRWVITKREYVQIVMDLTA